MLVEIVKDYESLSLSAARVVANQIKNKPDSVIGFATGSTPLGLYHNLIRFHHDEGLDFSKITCFNLDEYIGLPPQHEQSYHYFMWENLFKHINVNPGFVYIPSGMSEDHDAFCGWYERQIERAGGIDLQILGIGVNGHLAFNEPGSSLGSRTRIKTLSRETIEANARFFDQPEQVPRYAVTMGVGTIMEAGELLLLASGIDKADVIKATLEGPITSMVPATMIQLHPSARVFIDEPAASELKYDHHDGIAEPR